jgi:proprotein convertase subtilisin/kexin type 5
MFKNTVTNTCDSCHYTCSECDGAQSDDCLGCTGDLLMVYGNSCYDECPYGQLEISGTCQDCDPACTDCFGVSSDECTVCSTNYFLFGTTCALGCNDGYYQSNIDNSCIKCPEECTLCDSADFCTECIVGPYLLIAGDCSLYECLPGTYLAVSPELKCFDCDESCTECSGDTIFDCTACKNIETLDSGQCFTCEDLPGMKTPFDSFATECEEIKGDGFNFG